MKKRGPELNFAGKFMKLGLIFGNFLFFILGGIAIGIGIYLSVDRLDFVAAVFGSSMLDVSSICIVAAGCLAFVFCILGCCGAFLKNRIALLTYFVILCIVFILAVVGVTLAIVFRSWVTEQVRTYMTDVLKEEYGVHLNNSENVYITRSWDEAQQKWYCCGVVENGWGVYRGSEWYGEQPGVIDFTRPFVPQSCCVKDQYGKHVSLEKCQTWTLGPPRKQAGETNEAVFYKGCYDVGKEMLYSISLYLVIMGIVIATCAIGGIVLALFFSKRV